MRSKCSDELLEKYTRGELSDRQAAAIERHATSCSRCQETIDREMEPIARLFREAFPALQVPEHVYQRIKSEAAKPAKTWLRPISILIPTAAMAACLILLFWPQENGLQLESTTGITIVNGRKASDGDVIANESRVSAIGPATFTLPGVRITAAGPRTMFEAHRNGNEWKITLEVGSILMSDGPQATKYTIRCQGSTIKAMGTRFAVSLTAGAAASVSVFEDAVEIRSQGSLKTIVAGMTSALDGTPKPLSEDRYLRFTAPSVLVPSLTNRAVDPAPVNNKLPLPENTTRAIAEAEKQIHLNPNDPRPYMQVAVLLTLADERPSAAQAAQEAIRQDPNLSGVPDEALWTVLRAQFLETRGDVNVAEAILRTLHARQSLPLQYRNAWRAIIAAKRLSVEPVFDKAERIYEAVQNLLTVALPDDLLYAAELLQYDVAERHSGKRNQALREAKNILTSFLGAPESHTTAQIRAVALHRMNECLFWLEDRLNSIKYLEQAVQTWSVPRWKVHLGTRLAETGSKDRERIVSLIREGLTEDPSWYAYQRTIGALILLASSDEDWNAIRELLLWIGNTLPYLADANIAIGRQMMEAFGENQLALTYYERGVNLLGVNNLPQPGDRTAYATLLWRAGRHAEALSVIGKDPESWPLEAYSFWEDIGDLNRALLAIRTAQHKSFTPFLLPSEAAILRKLGRTSEAVAAYKKFIAMSDDHRQKYGTYLNNRTTAYALILLAETVAETDPKLATKCARRVIDERQVTLFTDEQARDSLEKLARAYWLVGDKQTAIQTLQQYIASSPPPTHAEKAKELLAKWSLQLTSQ